MNTNIINRIDYIMNLVSSCDIEDYLGSGAICQYHHAADMVGEAIRQCHMEKAISWLNVMENIANRALFAMLDDE